jgi:hypothetical protein
MEVMVLFSNKMAKLGLVLLACECRGRTHGFALIVSERAFVTDACQSIRSDVRTTHRTFFATLIA